VRNLWDRIHGKPKEEQNYVRILVCLMVCYKWQLCKIANAESNKTQKYFASGSLSSLLMVDWSIVILGQPWKIQL
jgi:hypothetical protein